MTIEEMIEKACDIELPNPQICGIPSNVINIYADFQGQSVKTRQAFDEMVGYIDGYLKEIETGIKTPTIEDLAHEIVKAWEVKK